MRWWILIILLYATVLRLFLLTEHPSGFHIDEVTLGYNAYSLLHTGRDETGRLWPLYSTSFGLDRALGNFLLVAGSIRLLGLNEFAVRFPFALAGIVSVYLVYLLAKEVVPSEKYALLAAFFLTISPWHLNIVRASSEASVSLALILYGQWLLLRQKEKPRLFPSVAAAACFLLSVFFYHGAVGFLLIATPVTALLFWLYSSSVVGRFRIAVVYGGLFLSLGFFFLYGGGGTNRFAQVGFMNDPSVGNEQTKMFYEEGTDKTITARIFHNKIVTYTRALIRNYFTYYSADFLLLDGGKPPRYSPPAMGLFYPYVLPFVLLGMYYVWRYQGLAGTFIITLFFLSPVISAVTYEYTPNVQRAFFMVAYAEMLAAYGVYSLWQKIPYRKLFPALLLFVPVCFVYYFHQYYRHFPVHDPLFRNDGAKELVLFLKEYPKSYDYVMFTNDPEPPYHYLLFFTGFDPVRFQELYAGKKDIPGGWLFEDRYFFSTERCPSVLKNRLGAGNYLSIDHGQCSFTEKDKERFIPVKNILRKDGSVLYRILRDSEL